MNRPCVRTPAELPPWVLASKRTSGMDVRRGRVVAIVSRDGSSRPNPGGCAGFGYAMADHVETSPHRDAIDMAARNVSLPKNVTFHSVRSSNTRPVNIANACGNSAPFPH